MTISTIVLAITGALGGGGGTQGSPQRDEGFWKKWLEEVSKCTQKTSRRGRWGIVCYCGKCCWCNFKFPWKGCWIFAKHIGALIAGWWLMQKVKKSQAFASSCQKYLYPVIKHKKVYSSSSSRMEGTPMAYNSSLVKSISLKRLYFRSACPSSSNLLNTWTLFGLSSLQCLYDQENVRETILA